MSEVNYWSRRVSRRRLMRGGAVVGLGLAGAALIGCGSDKKESAGDGAATPAPGSVQAAAAAGQPKRGGKIRVLTQSGLSFERVDPVSHSSQIGDSAPVGMLIQEHLFTYDPETAKLKTRLAESVERPDRTTYVLKLKQNATFQDGNPVTAEDVVYTMSRHDRSIPNYSLSGKTPAVLPKPEAVDKFTVRWTLKNPYPDMLDDLAGGMGALVSKKSYATSADPYGMAIQRIENPVTAAPFIVSKFTPRERVDVKRYDGYWDGGAKYLDEISTVVNPDDAVRVTQLHSGEAHLIGNIPPWDVAPLQKDSKFVVSNRPALKVQEMVYNTAAGPFSPPMSPKAIAFRRAFMMAIDRDALVKNIWNGVGAVADSFMHPVQFGYKGQKQAAYDPKQAKALLEQNGWDFNYTVKFLTASGTFTAQNAYAEAMAQMLTSIGIKVKLNIMSDYPAMTKYWITTAPDQLKEWDFLLGNLTMAPASAQRVFGIVGPSPQYNLARWNNPKVDDLMNKVLTEDNDTPRAALLDEVQKIAAEEAGISGLTYSYFSVGWDKRLQGVILPQEGWDLRNAWLNA